MSDAHVGMVSENILCLIEVVANRAIFCMLQDSKTCEQCGRTIEWRRKWEKAWESIRYCSEACRRARLQPHDHALESSIIALLTKRAHHASICPSEAAREVFPGDWTSHMEAARQAARRLTAKGQIEITQGGSTVDPSTAKGPIRLRRGRDFPAPKPDL